VPHRGRHSVGLVAGIGIGRWFMSNYENVGDRRDPRIDVASIVREQSR
jgi:hypothetical protein